MPFCEEAIGRIRSVVCWSRDYDNEKNKTSWQKFFHGDHPWYYWVFQYVSS
ncbi:hypothetical protein OAF38_01225 [bacterium]|nr:hypothetical protein [bacterium]